MSSLAERLKSVKLKPKAPLWSGPAGEGPNGGVTQSMLGRWLACQERFRVEYIEGLRPAEGFESKLEWGNMWHVCEEAVAAGRQKDYRPQMYEEPLAQYVTKLERQFPFQKEAIWDAFEKVRIEFPLYVEHWAKHPDMQSRTPLLAEQIFDVPYRLPSGRTVRLRGKWDSVDLVGKGKDAEVWLMENKTKSTIDRKKLERQLKFDLQTMLYLIALESKPSCDLPRQGHYWHGGGIAVGRSVKSGGASAGEYPIRGVRYNVIRRSAHVQKKKSREEFAAYLSSIVRKDIAENPTDNGWFARWNCEVTQADIAKFKRTCLDPILENIADDYEWWKHCLLNGKDTDTDHWNAERRKVVFPHHCPRTYRYPYGVYSSISEGGFGDVDAYLESGSVAGLRRAEKLFTELQ